MHIVHYNGEKINAVTNRTCRKVTSVKNVKLPYNLWRLWDNLCLFYSGHAMAQLGAQATADLGCY